MDISPPTQLPYSISKNYRKVFLLLILAITQQFVFAQNRLATKVNQAKALNPVSNYKVFSQPLAAARLASDTVFVAGAPVYRFGLDATELNRLSDEKKPYLEMSLPLTLSQNIDLELVPHTIFAPSFKVTDSKGQVLSPRNLGVFYQGIVKGDVNSVVSISIINGEIAGIISQKTGNWNLGKEGNSSNYILFNERDVKNKPTFNCTVQEPDVKAMGQNLIKSQASLPNVACGSVEIYIEADNALYQAQGSSSTNAVNYVNNLFSKVATLYTNEGLSVVISQIKVWDTADPYVGYSSTSSVLSAFRSNIGTTFNGRLAHFLSGRGLGGGIAYLDVLCEKSYAHGVSGSLSSTIVDLPTYSWNVEVVTHEIGHNFGSPHTQSCDWPGGAIDNCYTTEGGCPPGPAPTNGGTIMSYCHLTSTGINFSNGFGPLPGDLIRSYTQACLGSAVAPSNLAASEIYATQALVSWTHTSGTYTVEYKPSSSSTWISAGSTGNKNKYLTSLTANTTYDWRVNANCSVFSTGTFTTNSTPSPAVYCTPTFTDACTYGILITGVQLGGTILSSSSGCAAGGYTYYPSPVKSLALGQPNSFTVNLEGYYNAAQVAIWIDLDKNGTFETTEKLFTTSSGQTQAITGTVTIPVSTSLGSTRMRIIVRFSSAPTNPCGAYSYGEAEDYNVNITCPTISQYTVTGGGSYCAGGTGLAIGLNGSQAGLNYQLKRDGNNVGSVVAGTGAAISFGNQTIAGTYTVEAVAPSNSCTGAPMTGSVNVTITPLPTLASGTVTNPTTCGGTNGSIAFTTTNVPDGSYSLSYTGTGSPKTVTVSSNAFVLSGLTAGVYSSFSIANSGCTGTDASSKTLNPPATPILVSGTVSNPITCEGSEGSISFATTNLPDGNYSLSYTGTGSPKTVTVASNAFVLSGLTMGTYSGFSITNNGCTGTDATSKTLIVTTAPTLLSGTATNPTTCGGSEGSIPFTTTNLPNGSYSLTYTGTGSPKTITIASNSFVLSGLPAGVYSNFSITNNGCTGTDATSKTLNPPATPTLLAGTATNTTTCGGSEGSIAFTTTNLPNGSYSLTYTGTGSPKMITVASNAFVLSGLPAGVYSNFSITNNGCTGTDATSKTLNPPATPTLLAGTATNPTTCGGSEGSIPFTTTNLPNGSYSLTYIGTGSPKTITVASNAFVLSGLIAGTFSNFSITNNGCTGTDATSKTLNPPATPTLAAGTATNPTTCGGSEGSIAFTTTNLLNGSYSLTYTGTGSPKTITVASNAFVLSGLPAGVYSNFSITNNGCTGTDATSKTLNPPATPTLAAGTATNPTTCGGSEGSIAFTTTNLPNGSYSLTYTGTGSPKTITVASNAFVLSGLPAGVYSNFSITNNGCTGEDATLKTLTAPAAPTLVSGTFTNPTTCSGTDGSILFTTTNLPNGSYSLTYTGTGSPKTVTVASNAFVLSGLPAGVYSNFSITNNGCTGTDATSKTLNPPATPTLLAGTATNPTTCGGSEGSIAFTTTNLPNGSYSLTYTGTGSPKTITVASNAFVLSGLPAGVYSNFSITNNGCTGTDATSKTLNPPATPTLLAGTATNPTTCGGSEGSIPFTTTNLPNGSYSLTYTGTGSPKTITVASNSFVLSGLPAGVYSSFSITNNGCTGTDATSNTLNPPATPTLLAGTATNPTTCGGNEGSISFTTTNLPNGSYNLIYTGTGSPKTITVASNAFVLNGLPAGVYSNFSITNNGCTGTDATSKTLNPPATPTLLAGTATNPTTCGGSEGSIAFTTTNLSNGSYSLTYTGTGSPKTITVVSNAFVLSGLPAGVYSSFSITNNGCTGTDATSKTLNPPVTPTLAAGTATNPTTCGGSEGSIAFITTNLPNGSYSLTYTGTGNPKTITVASNAFVLSGLIAGTYSNFSITNNGCTGTEATSKILNPPATPTLAAGTATNPTTCGGSEGSIAFITTNLPNGSYSLTYTGTGNPKTITVVSNAFVLSGLIAGTYSNFSITNNGCTGTDATSKTLNPPAAPTLLAGTVIHPTTCSGTDGSISFTTTNLPNGSYSLTYTGTVNPKTITVASNAFVLNGLGSGVYSNFSITNNGCTGTDATSKTLAAPAAPTLLAGTVTNPTTCNGTNGSISFATTNLPNGSYSLTYIGTGSPQTITVASNAFILSGLIAGTYSNFSITNNGCTGTDATSKTLNPPATPTLAAGTATNPTTCGGTNGSIAFTTTNLPNGSYSLSYIGTGSPQTITVASNAFILSGLIAGTYSNFSITNNGCTGTDVNSKTLNPPATPILVAGTATNPTTCGGTNGSIAFTTTNLPNGSYSLSYIGTGTPKTITVTSSTFLLSGLPVGVYSNFSITNNGCTGTDATSKTLNPPATPTLAAGTATNPTTCGGSEGSIAFTTTNLPNGSYSLSYIGTGSPKTITVASNAFVLSGLTAGTYSNFSITNNGCTGTDATSRTLNPPATPTLAAGTATNPTTCGGSEGSIAFTTTNLPNGSYSLSYTGTGTPKTITVTSNTFLLSGLPVGVYSNFSITNNGCIGTDATSKTLIPPLSPTLTGGGVTNPTTCGGTNGSIPFTTTNVPNGNYSLSYTGTGSPKTVTVTGNSFVLSGLPAGTYSNFSITNNGCIGTDATPKTLIPPPTPTVVAGVVTNPTTCTGSNGSIGFTTSNLPNGNYTLNYTGNGSPKTITVASNGFTLAGLSAGVYSNFSITNNGCTGTDVTSKTLTAPLAPTLTAGTTTNPTTCGGTEGSISFSTNLPNGNYTLTYTGTGSPKTVTVASNSFTLGGLAAGTYSDFSITNNGCTGFDASSKTLNPPASPNAGTITGTLTICVGTTTTLASNGVSGGVWSSSIPSVASINPTTGIATGLVAGSTIITYTVAANGCTSSTTATLTIAPASVGGTVSGSRSVCIGSNAVNLNLTGQAGIILNWQASLTSDFAATINVVNATTSLTVNNLSQTTYFRAVVRNGICSVANSSSAVVTVNPLPVVNITGGTTIPVGGTTTLTPTTGGVWVSNNTAKATVTNAGIVTGVEAGTANFTFTQSSTGCSNTTNVVTVTGTTPCNQAITLVSPTDDYSNGTVTKQTNLSINASNKISGTGTTVTYQSGSSVTLGPGFKADAGTVFKTQIGGCN